MEGTDSFKLANKLKLLKARIIKWKKEEFGGIESQKRNCLQKLDVLEKKELLEGLKEDDRTEKMMLKDEFHRLLRMEEIS